MLQKPSKFVDQNIGIDALRRIAIVHRERNAIWGAVPLPTVGVQVMLAATFVDDGQVSPMARPASVPITRLRFRGHTDTLNAICNVLRQHPNESLTAAAVAEFGELDFRDVYLRLSETPELFVHLRKKKGQHTRYRMTSAVTKMTVAEAAAFIDEQVRNETRLVVIVVSVFMLLATLVGVLSRFD